MDERVARHWAATEAIAIGHGGVAIVARSAEEALTNTDLNRDQKIAGGVRKQKTFAEAARTIVIADAVMGLDNVLGVAGAAHGSYLLVVTGLLISVPIVLMRDRPSLVPKPSRPMLVHS